MTTFKELCDKAKEVCTTLKPKQRHALSSEAMAEAAETIDRLMQRLAPFLPPSAQEKKAAKAHPTASQIILFTTGDRDRKRYFNIAYFQKKFRGLPAHERRLIVPTLPRTLGGIRDALILYYYREGRFAGRDVLGEFQAALETEYNNLPHVLEFNRMKSLYRELLSVRNLGEMISRLCTEIGQEAGLLAFAKANKLKIPPQKSAKKAPRTTPHERLAEVIFKKGSLVRLDI